MILKNLLDGKLGFRFQYTHQVNFIRHDDLLQQKNVILRNKTRNHMEAAQPPFIASLADMCRCYCSVFM